MTPYTYSRTRISDVLRNCSYFDTYVCDYVHVMYIYIEREREKETEISYTCNYQQRVAHSALTNEGES